MKESKLLFMEGYVYHSRSETAANSFRYPILNIYFSVQHFNELKTLFKNKFLRILSFHEQDHLENKKIELNHMIENFLTEKLGIQKEKFYDDVFLQTIPRMFGYVFNPVSFWYFFKNNQLMAVLCEVNNTFSERHYYWLQQNEDLNNKWIIADKEFHVSPFFDIKGQYKFKFILNPERIEAHIQFITDDHKNRLITWVKGDLKPITDVSLLKILLKYGWMTPLVVYRIHYQAVKLFFKKVKFFKKPEPPQKEVTYVKTNTVL